MDRGGAQLKAFAPQLQTTFVKSLSDPQREVRERSALALGKLVHISLRIDPLLTELSSLCLQTDSNAIRVSMFNAAVAVVNLCGDKASPAALEKLKSATVKNLYDEDDGVRLSAARTINSISLYSPVANISDLLLEFLAKDDDEEEMVDRPWSLMCGKVLGICATLQASGSRSDEFREECYNYLYAVYKSDDRLSVKIALAR